MRTKTRPKTVMEKIQARTNQVSTLRHLSQRKRQSIRTTQQRIVRKQPKGLRALSRKENAAGDERRRRRPEAEAFNATWRAHVARPGPRTDAGPQRGTGQTQPKGASMTTHDLAGLEAHLALLRPLEQALVALDAYRTQHQHDLRPVEQQGLNKTLQLLAMTVQTILDRPAVEREEEVPDNAWKPTKPEAPSFVCRVCGSDNVWYRHCTCSDFDDMEYHCRGCDRHWWCEGADA